jgi:L-lactate utilization protein LutC
MSSSRDDFLDRVRHALAEGSRHAASPAIESRGAIGYQGSGADPVSTFVTQLEAVGGTAHVVQSPDAAVQAVGQLVKAKNARRILLGDSPLLNRLALRQYLVSLGMEVELIVDLTPETAHELCFAADIGISGVDSLVAETGTLVISAGRREPRSLTLLPPVHIAVAELRQLLADLFDLFDAAHEGSRPPPSCLTLITGPSKTGDIELRLVTGVHGPGEVHVVLLDR